MKSDRRSLGENVLSNKCLFKFKSTNRCNVKMLSVRPQSIKERRGVVAITVDQQASGITVGDGYLTNSEEGFL
jgi:hypothetical protein